MIRKRFICTIATRVVLPECDFLHVPCSLKYFHMEFWGENEIETEVINSSNNIPQNPSVAESVNIPAQECLNVNKGEEWSSHSFYILDLQNHISLSDIILVCPFNTLLFICCLCHRKWFIFTGPLLLWCLRREIEILSIY